MQKKIHKLKTQKLQGSQGKPVPLSKFSVCHSEISKFIEKLKAGALLRIISNVPLTGPLLM